MEIIQVLCILVSFSCLIYFFSREAKKRKKEILEVELELKKEILEAERCQIFERKQQYNIFLQQNLAQVVNDLYFRINEPRFNSDDLIYILNKNGLYLVDVDTFDQSYYKGE